MKLSLVVHAHQPPGNHDAVFREGIRTCYGPFLDLLEEFDHVRCSLHFSGSLLEWLERHEPARIEQLRRLVERGQVEPVTAGLYEPVLALLPQRDRVGQLRAHRAELQRLFGRDTSVGWLTERVWEPSMAADLAEGGVDTVPLDDRHFLSAGLTPDDLVEPFITEHQGSPITVAPASEALRMAIPWAPVDDVVAQLRRWAAEGRPFALFGDDMEKFGMWPGTYRDVIRGGWLRRFFRALDGLDEEIELLPLGEAVRAVPPRRKVYVPDGSYPEMLQWSLPPQRQRDLMALRERLAKTKLADDVSPFLRSGVYFQFLAKYPEANHLHKRMLDVSRRVARRHRTTRIGPGAVPEMLRDLWRAQCNDVYWHGWFGGAYLPHLRQVLWSSLLRAEAALRPAGEREQPLRLFDLDADLRDEAVVDTGALTAVVDPVEGAVVEVSDRRRAVNLADTLARRPEAYHPTGEEAPPYDRARRAWFVDRFLAPGRPPGRRQEPVDLGDFAGRPYRMAARRSGAAVEVTLDREAAVPAGIARVEKRLEFRRDVVLAHYAVEPLEARLHARFAVELNLAFFFTDHPAGRMLAGRREFALPRGGATPDVERCTLTVDHAGTALTLDLSEPAHVDVRPVYTVSQSEQGIERTPQCLACLVSWPLDLTPDDRFEVTLRLAIGPAEETAK